MQRVKSVVILLAVVALLGFGTAPAIAHHKDGHENGGNQSSEDVGKDDDGVPDDDDDNMHPSGRDRETNDGPTDDEQGTSGSDPDDDGRGPDRSNGGPDKPGGSGGVDLDDQDGNNGCGNDDDFEDDNEGWCGGKPKPQPTTSPPPVVGGEVITTVGPQGNEVLVEVEVNPQARTDQSGPTVLGERLTAAPRPVVAAAQQVAAGGAALPFTGAGLILFVILGLGLLGTGWAVTRRER